MQLPHTTKQLPDVGQTVQLACRKIWGGNVQTAMPISMPGLAGVLHAIPKDSHVGGDLYYLSACGAGIMSRMCIADVRGHGEGVADFATWLEQVFSAHMNRHSPSGVLREVNQRAVKRGLCLMTTALCFSYNSLNGRLVFCNAGHPQLRVCRAGSDRWEALEVAARDKSKPWNVPLAVTAIGAGEIQRQGIKSVEEVIGKDPSLSFDLGIAPYDYLSLGLRDYTHFQYFGCRVFTDAFCALLCWLLGGLVGLGTLICAFCLGPFIQFFNGLVSERVLQYKPEKA